MRAKNRNYSVSELNLPKSCVSPVDDFGMIELVDTKSNLDKGRVDEIQIERPLNCILHAKRCEISLISELVCSRKRGYEV